MDRRLCSQCGVPQRPVARLSAAILPAWTFAVSTPTIFAVMLPARRTDPAHDQALQIRPRPPDRRPARPSGHSGRVGHRRPSACRPGLPNTRRFPTASMTACGRSSARRGIDQLYTHQAAAIDHALAGRNVVITTPTASGKTLCYNAPVLERDPAGPVGARAVSVSDQGARAGPARRAARAVPIALSRRAELEIGVFTYDGDTPQDARRAIRGRAHVVLSNPDMVHSGILPHHPRWAKLFENLRYVVIDELHAYRGVFGSHLTNVLRRLRRICRHYGSNPTFICSSATIANPRELAEALVEQPFELVSESGAPRGEKFFLFVNPPVVNQQLGIRRSYLAETRRIAAEFLKRQLQLIVFAQSRLATEILTTYLKDDFDGRRARPSRFAAIAAATCRSAGARSRRGCARAACARSCRPTRSSSASTSARSTSA